MSFNPFIGSPGGGSSTFTKDEIIELLKLELDVADYQKDKVTVDSKIEQLESEHNNVATEKDIDDLFN